MEINVGSIIEIMEGGADTFPPNRMIEFKMGQLGRFRIVWNDDYNALEIKALDGRIELSPIASNALIITSAQ